MKPEEFELYLTNRKASVVDALQKIDKNSKGLLFVINEEFICCFRNFNCIGYL